HTLWLPRTSNRRLMSTQLLTYTTLFRSWGINAYKAGDPILFNEFNMFSPLIHNNTKGKILTIQKNETEISFKVQVEKAINEMDRSEEHTSELQSRFDLVCRLLLDKKREI